MKTIKHNFRTPRWLVGVALTFGMSSLSVLATPRTGEAVVAGHVGKVQARVFTGSVHDGATTVKDLSDGSSVGEASRVMTGKKGEACMVLSPGAVLCVAPQTELMFNQLRHSAVGLPKTEADLVRTIHIDLKKGRVLLRAGDPSPSMDIRVQTKAGVVESHGGSLVVAQTGEAQWGVISESQDQFVTPNGGERTRIPAGEAFSLLMDAAGNGQLVSDSSLLVSPVRQFELWEHFFTDLETFISDPLLFNRAGLSQYIGTVGGIEFVGSIDTVSDVSPSVRMLRRNERIVPQPSRGTRRWGKERVWSWYNNIGTIRGVNYIPRHAVNSSDTWAEKHFNEDRVDAMKEEIEWAHDAGLTTLRVQLQYEIWKKDPDAFLKRMEKLLDYAGEKDLQATPILFDDKNFAGKAPSQGDQPEPTPGQHNAHWTPSPGAEVVQDRSEWPNLEKYVKSILKKFKDSEHVAYWDLYNRTGDGGSGEASLPLMEQAFNWARDVNPSQPLAVPAWSRYGSAMSARMLERSDIITFQSFDSPAQVEALLLLLENYERPIICSDWLMRQKGNSFEKILPIFSAHRVGWFSRGLANGKTQEWVQHESHRSETDPDVWQHDLLDADGEPYDEEEIKQIKEFKFQ